MNILIIEDDLHSKYYLEKLLGKYDYKIHSEVEGDKALEYISENQKIDLILLDLKIPHIGGFELLKIIKEKYKHICIIVQSAYAMQNEKEKAIQLGCDGFVTKPIDPDELLNLIEVCKNK
jgi:CheY-like chemotaxis protein